MNVNWIGYPKEAINFQPQGKHACLFFIRWIYQRPIRNAQILFKYTSSSEFLGFPLPAGVTSSLRTNHSKSAKYGQF